MVRQFLLSPLKPPVKDDRVGVLGWGGRCGWAQRGASLDVGHCLLAPTGGIFSARVEGVHAGL